MKTCNVNILIGKVVKKIDRYEDELIFTISEVETYKMFHQQDCCERVCIEDICGELDWLIDSPILRAEERSNRDVSLEKPKEWKERGYLDDSFTWTFYEFSTLKGSVTIRWYGTSNGYYSESVDFMRMEDKNENN